MGGKGSGGARTGSGPKPKARSQKWLAGTGARKRPPAPVAVDEFDATNDLSPDERHVWMRLAPHAFKARTLTPATEYQFVMLCRNIILERELALDLKQVGGANHRGIIQRVDAELARFGLAPMGKPMPDEAPKAGDEWDEFDQPLTVLQGGKK